MHSDFRDGCAALANAAPPAEDARKTDLDDDENDAEYDGRERIPKMKARYEIPRPRSPKEK